MSYSITPMTAAHVASVAQIWHEGWHEAHAAIVPEALTRLRVMASFEERSAAQVENTRVALSPENRVMGFCMVHADEIYQMYVSPAARGTGTAKALLSEGEIRIAQAGHGIAWLGCAIGNARAAAFYEKCGWVNMGEEVVELDTSEGKFPLVLWRMEKAL